jgi:ABC-type lipoprotein export system ATPase subunit
MSTDARKPVLEAVDIRKTFPLGSEKLEVLAGVSLRVAAGDSISIRGESGSGKTTLLNILAGLERPDTGGLQWEGRDISAETPSGLARLRAGFLGMVFQSINLIPELDVLDNILLARRIVGRVRPEDRERAASMLAEVGLAGREHQLTTKLSGGERQRIAVARALMNRPRLLIADEPTGNLDERTGAAVMDLLLGLCESQRTALVLVTHNPAHADRCRVRYLLTLGRIGTDS